MYQAALLCLSAQARVVRQKLSERRLGRAVTLALITFYIIGRVAISESLVAVGLHDHNKTDLGREEIPSSGEELMF